MTSWLVTGAAGMFGTELVRLLQDGGEDVVGLARAQLDVRDPLACHAAVQGFDVVVNAAAWTDVDGAESHEADAFAVNATGAANLARACSPDGTVLVQLSTDYVFAGDASVPYPVDAAVSPVNAYGRTKAAAEWAVRAECPTSYVVRTSWLYGEHGPNFVSTLLRLASEKATLDVVDDQRGQPTWTRDLAVFVRSLVASQQPFGTVHGTAAGEATWFGLARAVFELAALGPERIRPVTSDRFPRPAARPAYSVLVNDDRLPPWREALSLALPTLVGGVARSASRSPA